jgi:hypothetical protein
MSFLRRALAAVTTTSDCPELPVDPSPGAGGVVDLPAPTGRGALADPAGEAWQAETDRRWQAAQSLGEFVPVPLPTWAAPPFVTRELLGRFLADVGGGLLHDVANATEACAIDAVASGQWIHFAAELEANVGPDIADCPNCIGAETEATSPGGLS